MNKELQTIIVLSLGIITASALIIAVCFVKMLLAG